MLIAGFALAVIENELDDPKKALPKLRLSENDEVNETLEEWFEKPYQYPRIVVSVDNRIRQRQRRTFIPAWGNAPGIASQTQ